MFRITLSFRSPRGLRAALLAGLVGLALAGSAPACQICVPRPTQTLADRLLQSDTMVLAREDPQRPFHYAAIETLKGNGAAGPIDAFLNSQARRRLALDQDSAMLLGRDAKSGEWRTLGIAEGDFERVTRRILTFVGDWKPNETNNTERLQEFAPLLGHQDIRLHELAYLEIGRAPYASIKAVSADVPLEKVRAMLDNPRYIEWRGLDILLLGMSDVAQDHTRVVREMEDRQRLAITMNLDAWATAYLEITGAAGIDRLEDWYFRDPSRSRDELRAIIRALSVHASGTPDMREHVVAAYRVLTEIHPKAAPDITRDLIAWREWRFADQLRRLRARIAANDPLGAYAVDLYLRGAETHSRRNQR